MADLDLTAAGQNGFATVRAAVANLVDHAATQESGRGLTREGSTSKAVAREALRDDLEAIIRTARAMAVTTPGIDDKFRMPRGGDQHLLTAARAFARDAAPLAQRFIEHYLPEDFLTDLDQDVKNFESAMRGQDAGKGTKAAAAASHRRGHGCGSRRRRPARRVRPEPRAQRSREARDVGTGAAGRIPVTIARRSAGRASLRRSIRQPTEICFYGSL